MPLPGPELLPGPDLLPEAAVTGPTNRLYGRCSPIAHGDQDAGWPLYHLCDALTLGSQPLDPVIRGDDTHGPLERMVDPDEAPEWVLPWLQAIVGVGWNGDPAADLRALIETRPRHRRATIGAIRAAAQDTLAGTKTVFIQSRRLGNFWSMAIGTYATETPDPDRTEAAIRDEKMFGVVLDFYGALGPWTCLEVASTFDSTTEVMATFATCADLEANTP